MCVCKCVRIHTVSFFSEDPDSHSFNTSVMRAGCVCVCVCVATQGVKQRRARGAVIWLTSDLTSMCVAADQEHSPLMGEHHHLGCCILLIVYHGTNHMRS